MDWSIVITCSALIITVIGWYFTYRFNIKAQEKALLNQIMNDARLAIEKELIGYEKWLSKYLADIQAGILIDKLEVQTGMPPADWSIIKKEVINLTTQPENHSCFYLLENYEILFPETREIRQILVKQNQKLAYILLEYASALALSKEQRTLAFNKVNDKIAEIEEHFSLIRDLGIYLQNKTLSSITGNVIPSRETEDSSTPRIVMQNGNLTITGS